ncbi:hypothetical protein [Pleionea sediminis]|uniref:hypothetical protein n=1 Tax=Pleionea sediminis TaxID=2569479 RepID=UPI0011856583|nr:hypothetical protein [Pleionea sediminis]
MEINHVLSVEVLRDGGSLVVSFQSDDSCEYWLMFPIESFDLKSPVFKEPVLVNRTTSIEVGLSYNSAQAWLNRLATFIVEPEQKKVLSKMQGIVNENT